MTVPPVNEHPIWCLREDCDTRGLHASRALTASNQGAPTEPVVAQLVKLVRPRHTQPYITLTRESDGVALAVGIAQARILRRFLGRLVELVLR